MYKRIEFLPETVGGYLTSIHICYDFNVKSRHIKELLGLVMPIADRIHEDLPGGYLYGKYVDGWGFCYTEKGWKQFGKELWEEIEDLGIQDYLRIVEIEPKEAIKLDEWQACFDFEGLSYKLGTATLIFND